MYRWYKGAQELKYCTGGELRVEGAGSLDNGQYCCTVSNAYGSVLSDVVLVKVVLQKTALPSITTAISECVYSKMYIQLGNILFVCVHVLTFDMCSFIFRSKMKKAFI